MNVLHGILYCSHAETMTVQTRSLRMMTTAHGCIGESRGNVIPLAPLFDVWLQTTLQRRYDDALSEPVPDDLLDLVPQPTDKLPD